MTIAMPADVQARDFPCLKCGYNLRGLDLWGRCPECGTAVGYSLRSGQIRYSDPDWLRTLRRGIRLILLGVLALVLIVVIAVFIGAAVGSQGPAVVLAQLGGLLAQGLLVYGTWLLTTPDPSGLGEREYGLARRLIRVTLLIGVGGTAVNFIAETATLPEAIVTLLAIANFVASLIGIVGFCAQLIYLSRLALRLPDERMATRARKLAWTIGVTYALLEVAGRVPRLFVQTNSGLACATGIVGITLVVAMILYLLLLERFAQALKGEEAIARESWARAVVPTVA